MYSKILQLNTRIWHWRGRCWPSFICCNANAVYNSQAWRRRILGFRPWTTWTGTNHELGSWWVLVNWWVMVRWWGKVWTQWRIWTWTKLGHSGLSDLGCSLCWTWASTSLQGLRICWTAQVSTDWECELAFTELVWERWWIWVWIHNFCCIWWRHFSPPASFSVAKGENKRFLFGST